MTTLVHRLQPTRDNAGYLSVPVVALPPGCRGAACPAYALCQGRCGTGSGDRPVQDGRSAPAA